MLIEEGFSHLARDARRLEGRAGLQQFEAARVLAEIGAEAALIRLLAAVAVIADEDGDLSRRLADIVEGPAGGAADFPGIEADIAHIAARGELRDEGKGLYVLFRQRLDGAGDDGMLGGDDAEDV